MAINLIDTVMENLKGPVLEQLGAWLGASPEKTHAVTGSLVPVILAGLADQVAEPEGPPLFGTLLDRVDDGLLDRLGAVFKNDEAAKIAESGGDLLSSLFGEDSITAAIEGLAGAVGLGADKVRTLLGFLTPVVLGALKRLITRKGLSLSWLAGLFAKQQASFAGLLPKGWTGFAVAATAVAAAIGEPEADEPEADVEVADAIEGELQEV